MITLCITMAVVLAPSVVYAWGGGIHLQAGINVLSSLSGLPGEIAAILAAHPHDFLYGSISADITVGKKFTHYLLNCHRWRMGRKVLTAARTDAQKACAYGYLCHLAADVVAHNYFVPYKIMRSFSSMALKHAYWEMRFETFAAKETWDMAREVCLTDQAANDKLLRGVLANTLFSFGTNKRIFNSIMLLSRLERWQRVMQTLSNNSRYKLSEEDRDEYLHLTEEAVFDFLRNPGETDLLRADPTGEKALAAAEAVRRNLRFLYKGGRLTREQGMEQVEMLKDRLRQAICKPEILRELYNG